MQLISNAKYMLIFLSIALLIAYLISIHINFRVEAAFDFDEGKAFFVLSVFYIPVYKAQGLIRAQSLTEGDITLVTHKKKRNMHIKIDKESIEKTIKAIKRFNFTLFTNLDVVKIYLKIDYGNTDAFKTFAYLGIAKILFYSTMSALKSKQRLAITEQFTPKFDTRTIKAETLGIFRLSLADIIYGFALSKAKA